MSNIHVSIIPEPLFNIGPVEIHNSIVAMWVIIILFFVVGIFIRRSMKVIPSRVQLFFEIIATFVMDQLKNAFGSERRAKKFFYPIITPFVLITLANQLSLLPLFYQITYGGTAIVRTATAHLSLTLVLALGVVIAAQAISFVRSPLKHIGKYIKIAPFFKVRSIGDFGNALLEFTLGLLDIVGEVAKVLSLSIRLFGNVFAGEVLVLVIAGLTVYTSFLVPVPFMIISIFSGFVQAFVFMLLSIQFLAQSMEPETEVPSNSPVDSTTEGLSLAIETKSAN